jgi:Ser/Thr protein kinase RdoA (MazF antagonist)
VTTEPGHDRVLRALGVPRAQFLGRGSEAAVYALDARRIARIHRSGVTREAAERRAALLRELAEGAAAVPFAVPEVLDVLSVAGRPVTLETRLPGRPLSRVLGERSGSGRAELVRGYLDAATRVGDLPLERPWFGDLLHHDPVRSLSYREYLRIRAERNLAQAGAAFESVDAGEIAAALPEPGAPALVHLDAFPGNVLVDGVGVTAIIDFGPSALLGDRILDPLASAAYLDAPITPTATDADRGVAAGWLAERGLQRVYPAARRWLGAYWSFAQDDVRLFAWCRQVLLTA